MNELYHHGIKGMKWGVRKRREESEVSKMNKKVNTRNDAFILKKGSHIHRSTYDSEDANRNGHAFATFKIKDAKGYASRNKLFSGEKKHLI